MASFLTRVSPLIHCVTTRSLLGGVRTMRIASRPSDLIVSAPLLDLTSLLGDNPQNAQLVGKLESLGPCSSVKDRLGRSMI